MLKMAAAGTLTLLVIASPPALAQTSPVGGQDGIRQADTGALTDERISVVKAALQLTPDQEKYWPAIENAIRARAKDRRDRLADEAKRASEVRGSNPVEVWRNRDAVAFLNRRADALTQRAGDLKKLADAWQPLYQTLSADQKRRMAVLATIVFRDVRDDVGQRRAERDDDEED